MTMAEANSEPGADSGIHLGTAAAAEISRSLRELLAEVLGLYLKTKSFEWRVSGRHLLEYAVLLDEQGRELFAMADRIAEHGAGIGGSTLSSIHDMIRDRRLFALTNRIAERERKIGANTLRMIRDVLRQQVPDSEENVISAARMLKELSEDNRRLALLLRFTHALGERHNDAATARLMDIWQDQTERRAGCLSQIVRDICPRTRDHP
jgi:starvation-inducible DNA-binding protein